MIVYLHDKRQERVEWMPKLQHVLGGIPLLWSGIQHLADESERLVAFLEIAIAVAVLGALVRDVRSARKHAKAEKPPHERFGWFDLAAGAMLLFEAYHSPHHKPAWQRPQFLSGVTTIALGLFHGPFHTFVHRRRYLRADEARIEYRGSPFRRFAHAWAEVASVELTPERAVLQLRSGRRRSIHLARYRNAEAVRQALAAHAPDRTGGAAMPRL
jgi:hypothetical protein